MTRNSILLGGLALAALGIACEVSADAMPPAAPPQGFNPSLSLAPLVDAIEPAVVNVYVTTMQRTAVNPLLQQLYGLPSEREVQGQGSGFVISQDGYILTNNHVAGGATDIKVKFASGDEYPAKVVGTDKTSDVALLRIDAKKSLPWLQLGDSDQLKVGDWVVAVGNPLGLGHTVTAGILSGKGRDLSDNILEEFLQTDASINPGNSGGPLISLDGKVVGINTAIIQNANSVGFAIPSSYLQNVVPQLQKGGKVAHGYLGIEMGVLNDVGKKQLGVDHGVFIVGVASGGPAESAGLKPGDVILTVGGKTVDDQQELLKAIAIQPPGTELDLSVLHDGKPKQMKVKLAARPDELDAR